MVTFSQRIAFHIILVLRNGGGCIFGNQNFPETGNDLDLTIERCALCANGVRVQVFVMDHSPVLKRRLPVVDKLGNGPDEQPLDGLLV